MSEFIDVVQEIELLIKQVGGIEVLAEYADTSHHVEFGKYDNHYYLKLNGTLVKIDEEPQDVVANFYDQIARLFEDSKSGIDPSFANLRDILVSRNKFVQDSLDKLGEGRLAKTLSKINFLGEITEKSILKQMTLIEKADVSTSSVDEQTSSTVSLISEKSPFTKALSIIKDCDKCPQPYSPGKGIVDNDNNKVLLDPKPNNSGYFTYADDEDDDINLSTKAVIVNIDGQILILKDAYSEYWDLPGGHILEGEGLDIGLRREVREETGLVVVSSNQLFARELLLGDPPPRIVVFYVASAMGKLALSEEHTDAKWVTPDQLDSFNLGVFLPIIKQIIAMVQPESTPETPIIKDGHEMEMTDMGQPYYHQKHHQMDTYEMGEPDYVDNVQTNRHDFRNPPEGEISAGAEKNPHIKISTVKDVLDEHNSHIDNPVIIKFVYSEAGNPEARERPFIEPAGDASMSYEAGDIIPFSSGASVDNDEEQVNKQAAGGGGVAGEGTGAVGTVGALTTGDTFTPTHGGPRRKDYDSSLTQKQHPSTFAGAFEGTTTRPDYNVNEYEPRKTTARHDLRPEQQPLGEGEDNLWLSDEEVSPNTSKLHIDGDDIKRNTDDAIEQFTNLSADSFRPFLRKSKDDLDIGIVSPNAKDRLSSGKPLVVAGYGNTAIVDREGHLITLDALRKALPKFMENPQYRNLNIFHSGVQCGILLDEFTDNDGKVWKTHVDDKGLFVVVEFRTDIEVARKAMAEVLRGTLRGFSLAGNSNMQTTTVECKHGVCYKQVNDLEIYELTLCQSPVSPESWITDILQRPSPSECPECYSGINTVQRYDSSLRPIV